MSRNKRAGHGLTVPLVLLALLLIAGAVGAAGCGEATRGADTTAGPGGPIDHPGGAKELVLQVFAHDGFVPVSYHLTQLPHFSLYGDGTVIVTGPTIMVYPGPALPNLQVTTISEEAVQEILSAAREAGLFQNDVDYGQPGITDMPLTTIVVNAEGSTYTSKIYALGMEEGAGGLSIEQQQARATIDDLAGRLVDLTSFETGELAWAPYEYSALAVFSVAVDPTYTPGPDDVQPNRLEWPLGGPDSLGAPIKPEGYSKVVVSGPDLGKLQAVLGEATQITVWTIGDREYNLHFRPLLPDETE
ncbi:MAG: hypothetical protein JXA87_05865 [Thermoleophilia bacterium]|nr:hypothetical protein [Thermoleophilia bacterium]